MIYGIGTDIVAVARMQDSLDKHGERFARRILTDAEYEKYQGHTHPAGFLAKRFAAKEAAAKALGTGFRDGLSLQHIEVSNDVLGKPELKFYLRASELLGSLGIGASYLSLSDEKEFAVAYVVLTKAEGASVVQH